MNYLKERIEQVLQKLQARICTDTEKIEDLEVYPCGYKGLSNTPPADAEWKPFGWGETFGGTHEWHGWFRTTVKIPERMLGQHIELKNWVTRDRPQVLTYINGKTVQGSDPNHVDFPLEKGLDEFELLTYMYNGYNASVSEYCPELRVIDTDTRKLYWDIRVPFDVMCYTKEGSYDFCRIRTALNEAINLLDLRTKGTEEYKASVLAATKYLEENFYNTVCGPQEANVVCIGHTHIDVAWLWPLRQTREKAQRSFSTVVNMMKEFPEYKFMSSQPQLYKFVKEDDPALYEEIKKLVAEGRWEVEGAMWLEADCNLTSGESLVRQVLFGKRFIKEEFGKDSKVLWLPDVFGYSAALPQILRKAGVTRFVTSKISWNETNMLPCDVFKWYGIDGSEIFSYFLTAQDFTGKNPTNGTTYNANITPKQIRGTWERFQQKDIANEAISTFGHGDGGGGPTREMLETGIRLEKGIPGCPTVSFEFAGDFLDRMEAKTKDSRFLPKWVGELYLEYHRGTYTSIAKNKLKNRRSEFLYQNAELIASIGKAYLGGAYPQNVLNDGWEKILLLQFHDIIPGSSVKEVYDDSDLIYAELMTEGQKIVDEGIKAIAENVSTKGTLVFNPNAFTASGTVETENGLAYAENIPAKGWAVLDSLPTTCNVTACIECRKLENEFVRVLFDESFEITSIYDKKAEREIVPAGERANTLVAYEDIPRKWDAWEITNYYTEKGWPINEITSVELYECGAKRGFKITRPFQHSVIEQIITLTDYDTVVTFDTTADWKHDHLLVRTAFPTTFNTDKATYEIQYGNVERPTHQNTSWEQAKFEVCAHKWADIAEFGYGLSLLNDCKYGYAALGSTISMSLIKCATMPNPAADKEVHHFTYAIYPHSGDYRAAGTVQKAYLLNNPMTAVAAKGAGTLPARFSTVSSDKDNILVDVVKKAEDSDATVIRLYDAYNMTAKPTLTFGIPVSKVEVCDLLENVIDTLPCENNTVTLTVKPFEIVTLKLS